MCQWITATGGLKLLTPGKPTSVVFVLPDNATIDIKDFKVQVIVLHPGSDIRIALQERVFDRSHRSNDRRQVIGFARRQTDTIAEE